MIYEKVHGIWWRIRCLFRNVYRLNVRATVVCTQTYVSSRPFIYIEELCAPIHPAYKRN